MSKGENIYKRKDGRWEARYARGRDERGRILYGSCYGKTYREAKEKVTAVKAAMLSGEPIPFRRHSPDFAFYCTEWLKERRSYVKETTYVKYSTILERHILPKLGENVPSGITTGAIVEFTGILLDEEELSAKTVKDILIVLKSILRYTDRVFPEVFPKVDIQYPREDSGERRVLSLEEQERLIRYLLDEMDACRFGILLALFTGIRIGELCALRWGDVSVEDRIIRVTSTMQRIRNLDTDGGLRTKVVIGSTKSSHSVRSIPMTAQAAELCAQFRHPDPAAYILTGSTDYMEPRTLQYRLTKYTRECALDGVHFHTLRHTFATRCIEVGFEIKSLSEILGHASTAITMERYVHSSMALKRENIQKLSTVGL